MNLKTLNKENAIHVLNLVSMVMAFGVTSYFFDTLVTNSTVKMLGNFLITPVQIADKVFTLLGTNAISGNFLIMFLILWISYAIPMSRLYPFLMVRNHNAEDLHSWYLTEGARQ